MSSEHETHRIHDCYKEREGWSWNGDRLNLKLCTYSYLFSAQDSWQEGHACIFLFWRCLCVIWIQPWKSKGDGKLLNLMTLICIFFRVLFCVKAEIFSLFLQENRFVPFTMVNGPWIVNCLPFFLYMFFLQKRLHQRVTRCLCREAKKRSSEFGFVWIPNRPHYFCASGIKESHGFLNLDPLTTSFYFALVSNSNSRWICDTKPH